MKWLAVLALVACHPSLPEGFPSSFSSCEHGLSEADNFIVASDGSFKWGHDGCDYFDGAHGTWSVAGTEVVLHSSDVMSPWGDGDAHATWDGQHVTLAADAGVWHFGPGTLCGFCQLNGGCRPCANPPNL